MAFTDDSVTATSELSITNGAGGPVFVDIIPAGNKAYIMGRVGIGALNPVNALDVEGAMAVGASYSGTVSAPANGLIVEGNVGIGTSTPVNKLDVGGDIAIQGKHALRGNDPWLRLNQDGVFTSGVHTPGAFAPGSLNVGGAGGWGNPGPGNVWISGNVGIGTVTPKNRLDVEGGAVVGANYSGSNTAPPNGLLVEGNMGVGTSTPTEKLHVAGNIAVSGTVDGVDISSFKADVDGRASKYAQFGNLNQASTTVGTTWVKLVTTAGSHSFSKYRNDTKLEVRVNSRFSAGTFAGALGITFEARVDDQPPGIGNDGSITASQGIDFLSLYGVFANVAAGSHTVSIWARVGPTGSSTSVLVDPGGWGGKILVKETW